MDESLPQQTEKILKAYLPGYKQLNGHKPKCILPLSILQEYHNGDQLESIILVLNEHFSEVEIIVGDTLQRHNFDSKEALEIALEKGDKWLQDHQKHLDKLTIPKKISRWNDWIGDPKHLDAIVKILTSKRLTKEDEVEKYIKENINDANVEKKIRKYLQMRKIIETNYHISKNPSFYKAMNEVFREFAVKNKGTGEDPDLDIKRAKRYIFEELPIFLLWNEVFGEKEIFYFVYPISSSKISANMVEAFEHLPEMQNGKRKLIFQNVSLPGKSKKSPTSQQQQEAKFVTKDTKQEQQTVQSEHRPRSQSEHQLKHKSERQIRSAKTFPRDDKSSNMPAYQQYGMFGNSDQLGLVGIQVQPDQIISTVLSTLIRNVDPTKAAQIGADYTSALLMNLNKPPSPPGSPIKQKTFSQNQSSNQ